MLRTLRIAGIVLFALLVGFSSHLLYRMYDEGDLFDQYNSQRKSNVTLLCVSVLALGALGSFELSALGKVQRMGYGGRHYREENPETIDGNEAKNIYAVPKTVDPWHGRTIRGAKPKYRPMKESSEIWMGITRVFCMILPLAYMGIGAYICLTGSHHGFEQWVLPSLFSCLFLISAVVGGGVFCKRRWGLSLGYVLAVINLLLFPFGTMLGLLLLIGLVGAAPAFHAREARSRRSRDRSVAV